MRCNLVDNLGSEEFYFREPTAPVLHRDAVVELPTGLLFGRWKRGKRGCISVGMDDGLSLRRRTFYPLSQMALPTMATLVLWPEGKYEACVYITLSMRRNKLLYNATPARCGIELITPSTISPAFAEKKPFDLACNIGRQDVEPPTTGVAAKMHRFRQQQLRPAAACCGLQRPAHAHIQKRIAAPLLSNRGTPDEASPAQCMYTE